MAPLQAPLLPQSVTSRTLPCSLPLPLGRCSTLECVRGSAARLLLQIVAAQCVPEWVSDSTHLHITGTDSSQPSRPPTSSAPPLAHSQWPSHCSFPPSLLFQSPPFPIVTEFGSVSTRSTPTPSVCKTLPASHLTILVCPRFLLIEPLRGFPSPRTVRTRRPD